MLVPVVLGVIIQFEHCPTDAAYPDFFNGRLALTRGSEARSPEVPRLKDRAVVGSWFLAPPHQLESSQRVPGGAPVAFRFFSVAVPSTWNSLTAVCSFSM